RLAAARRQDVERGHERHGEHDGAHQQQRAEDRHEGHAGAAAPGRWRGHGTAPGAFGAAVTIVTGRLGRSSTTRRGSFSAPTSEAGPPPPASPPEGAPLPEPAPRAQAASSAASSTSAAGRNVP